MCGCGLFEVKETIHLKAGRRRTQGAGGSVLLRWLAPVHVRVCACVCVTVTEGSGARQRLLQQACGEWIRRGEKGKSDQLKNLLL